MNERRDTAPPPALGPGRGVRVQRSVVVRRTAAELYRSWRDLGTVARVFRHVERVTCVSTTHSHWVIKAPLGTTVEWDAVIINEVENHLIGWQSLPGADVDCAGSVHFEPRGDGSETEVRVVLRYDPPGGAIGAVVAAALGADPDGAIAEDLERFKRQVEAGQLPTKDEVQLASEESFPASDPPSWTAR
jgi:uncharacterized membrane protein